MNGLAGALKWLDDASIIEVPFFQRPYVWDDEDFEALIESFLESPDNTMPFFGSIILKKIGPEDEKSYSVIDGQQRLTTFNVLIRVLLDIYKQFSIRISDTLKVGLQNIIYHCEVDDEGEDRFSVKLIPSNPDKEAFNLVMDSSVERPLNLDDLGQSPIENAYTYFYNYFSKPENIEKVKKFSLKLINTTNCLIYITLDSRDDEQKIFDSVNSLGKSLSNSDIIKNYLFQKMRELAGKDEVKLKHVIDLYYKYWDKIFYDGDRKEFWYTDFTVGRIKTDNLESFLRDLGVIKKIYGAKKTAGSNGLCVAFKAYIETLSFEQLEKFVVEISEYANVYYDYKTAYKNTTSFEWSDYTNRLLLIFDYMETTTFNPYILKLLKDKPKDLETKLFNLEKFFLQRFIYGGTSKNYNQCCEGLIKAEDDSIYLKEYMLESPNPYDTYKNKLRSLTNKQGTLLLFLLEMKLRDGLEEMYSDTLNIRSYTLEHVMPQKWQSNSDWLLVDCFDEVGNQIDKNDTASFVNFRNKAVYSIGNFALLTKKLNTSISNSSFEIKVNGNGKEKGFGMRKCAASLSITKDIITVYDTSKIWNELNIYKNEKRYFDTLNSFYTFES